MSTYRRIRRLGTGVLALAAVGALLGACADPIVADRNGGPPPAPPSVPSGQSTHNPGGDATITYSGAESDTARYDSVACTVAGDKVTSVRTPAGKADTAPGLTAARNGDSWTLTVTTTTRPGGYTKTGVTGIESAKLAGGWTVTMRNVALSAADGSGTLTVTVNIACPKD